MSSLILLLFAFWLWTPDLNPSVLEARYLRSPDDRVDVAGVRLHVRDSGPRDAPAVILVHGFGASLHTWEPWAQALAAEYRVIRLDLPGCGLSGPDPTGDYTDARSVAVLRALMDQRGLAHATLVGHSMGGRIAWTFAASHPERLDKLVLLAPDGFASDSGQGGPRFAYGRAPEVPASAQLMRLVLPRALLRATLAPAYADPTLLTEATVSRYHDLIRAPGVRSAMIARMGQTVLVDPVPVLARIQTPTLLLWGAQDAMIPFTNAADYLRAIPNSRLVALPGLGHLPQEEAPERSVAPLLAFLHGRTLPAGWRETLQNRPAFLHSPT